MTTPSFPAISEFVSELSTLVGLSKSLKKEVEKKDRKITRLQRKNKKLLEIINDLSKRSGEDSSEEVEEVDETKSIGKKTYEEFLLVDDEDESDMNPVVFASSAYEAAKIFSERILGDPSVPGEIQPETYQFTGDSGKVLYEFTAVKDAKGKISTIFNSYSPHGEENKTETKKPKDKPVKKTDLDTFFSQLKESFLDRRYPQSYYHPLDANFVFKEIAIRGDREIICIGRTGPNEVIPLLSEKSKAKLQTFMTELGVKDLQTLEEVKDKLNMKQLKEYRDLIPKQPKIASHPQKVIDECLELNVARGVYYWSTHLMFCEMKIGNRDEIVCVGGYPGCEYDEADEPNEFMDSQPLNYFYLRMLRDFEKDSGFSVLNIRDLYLHGPETFSECQPTVKKLTEVGLMPGYD